MEISSLLGLILGFVVVMVVMIMDGGSPAELFAHPSAILLTVGGAVVASMVSSPLKTVLSIPALILRAIKGAKIDPLPVIETLTRMADKARREGLLALENEVKELDDPFLRKGLMMVVDGTDPALVRSVLEIEIENMHERHAKGFGFFNNAGGYAPTMGIIGTVMGLITVLKQLDEPSKLGKAIAGAFLATLWGIMSANIFWLPLGAKLASLSEEEASFRRMLIEGILAIQSGENPRMVGEKLAAFLPPSQRTLNGAKPEMRDRAQEVGV